MDLWMEAKTTRAEERRGIIRGASTDARDVLEREMAVAEP